MFIKHTFTCDMDLYMGMLFAGLEIPHIFFMDVV